MLHTSNTLPSSSGCNLLVVVGLLHPHSSSGCNPLVVVGLLHPSPR
jgi:hypothetical protein